MTAELRGTSQSGFGAEKHCRAEDSFEGRNEPPVLGPALLHTEGLQHLGCAPKTDCLALLPHRQSSEKNGNDPILPEWHSELWMPRDLENEVAVSALVQHLPLRQRPERKTTEYERPRTKAQVLIPLFPFAPDQGNAFYLPELPLRDDEIRLGPLQDRTCRFQTSFFSCTRLAYTSKECTFQRSPHVNAGPDPAPQVERRNRAAAEVAGCPELVTAITAISELFSQIGRKTDACR